MKVQASISNKFEHITNEKTQICSWLVEQI